MVGLDCIWDGLGCARQHFFAEASTKHKNRRTGKEQTQRRPRSLYKRKVTPDSLPKAVDVMYMSIEETVEPAKLTTGCSISFCVFQNPAAPEANRKQIEGGAGSKLEFHH